MKIIWIIFPLILSLIFGIEKSLAEDLQINEECVNNVLTITIVDAAGPIDGVSVYLYTDTSMIKFLDKVISDKNGKIKINFSDQLKVAKIVKENHVDVVKNLTCDEEFRTQSIKVFSVMDSSIGIIEDTNTKIPIVDLGTFYGIAGNGTLPDKIKIFKDNKLWSTINKETGIAPSTSHSEWQIPQTFFYNELPGMYKLILITNNTETLVFEFMVKQITIKLEQNSLGSTMDSNHREENSKNTTSFKMAPLKQITSGISPRDVSCKEGLQLIFNKINDDPACVKPTTADKLIERNWAKL